MLLVEVVSVFLNLVLEQGPLQQRDNFTSGNERSPLLYNTGTDISSGTEFYLRKEDKFMNLVELTNMFMEDKVVYVAMTYEILEGG
jgi:hypothetical protein